MRKTRWKVAVYAFLSLGTIVFAAALLSLFFYTDPFINTFLKGRITKAFRDAYPAYSIRIGSMHYSIPENRLGFDSVALTAVDSTMSCTIAAYSVSGIGWLELLWARGLVPHGFTGTVLDAHDIVVKFPQDQYELSCGFFHVSVPDSEIMVEAVEFHPSGDDEVFFAESKFRRTRFRLSVPHAKLTGLACLELLQGNKYRTRAVLIRDVFLDVLINKDKPAARDTSRLLMPNEILASVKEAIQVDSLKITNWTLNYNERFRVGSKPALLTFDSVQVAVTGIANHGTPADTIRIHAQGEFVKSGKMDFRMSIPVAAPDFSLRYSGSVSRMDLYKLNAWLEPSDQMRIKSGVLQAATFDIHVSAGHARGNVKAIYRNLSLASLDRRTGSEEGIADILISFVANTFKIRGDNVPDESGSMKIGVVNYARKREDPFFGFVWFALRSGVGDVAGF